MLALINILNRSNVNVYRPMTMTTRRMNETTRRGSVRAKAIGQKTAARMTATINTKLCTLCETATWDLNRDTTQRDSIQFTWSEKNCWNMLCSSIVRSLCVCVCTVCRVTRKRRVKRSRCYDAANGIERDAARVQLVICNVAETNKNGKRQDNNSDNGTPFIAGMRCIGVHTLQVHQLLSPVVVATCRWRSRVAVILINNLNITLRFAIYDLSFVLRTPIQLFGDALCHSSNVCADKGYSRLDGVARLIVHTRRHATKCQNKRNPFFN